MRYGDSGIIIHTDTSTQFAPSAPNICEDGHGGFYVVYGNNNLTGHPFVAHRFDSTGTSLWADTGILITQAVPMQYYQTRVDMINDNGNGVMMSFITNATNVGASTGIYAQRLDINGNRQWGNTGTVMQLGVDHRLPKVIADGSQGMVVVWANYSYDGQGFNYSLRIDCLDHNGASRFPSGSIKLNQTTNIGFGCFYRLILTQSKDFIVSWLRDGLGTPNIFAQKVDATGNFLWGAQEIKVRDTVGEVRDFHMITDGSEGAYYTWGDGRKVNVAYGQYAQHILGDSTKQWAPQGVRIDSAATENFAYIAPIANNQVRVFWVPTIDNRLHIQELDVNGNLLQPGLGTIVAAPGHLPLQYRSVLPVSNNHEILFAKTATGESFAKYVPFTNVVLPVKFISFTAVNQVTKNLLSWKTSAELNISFYSVERSTDGSHFNEIATVKSKNNYAAINQYSYADAALINADLYYRIKEVDLDGTPAYSNIVMLKASVSSVFRLVPNPVNSYCRVYFQKPLNENGFLKVTDTQGRAVLNAEIKSQQTFKDLDFTLMKPGIYFCRFETGGNVYTQKILVSH